MNTVPTVTGTSTLRTSLAVGVQGCFIFPLLQLIRVVACFTANQQQPVGQVDGCHAR